MDIKPSHRPGQQAFGPWGEHTSTLDWCEDNYVDFIYIAETWNALSNIPFILLALHGMITTLQERMPNKARYALAHAMIAFIGIGSFLFHSTLMWTAQVLLDELPMIYVSFQVLYCLLLEGRPSPSATYSTRMLGIHVGITEAKLICLGLPTLITLIYLCYPNPLFHQFSYGVLQVYITYKLQILRRKLPPDSKLNRDCTTLLNSGVVLALLAFGIWNVDNVWCDDITRMRENRWWSVLTQGHAWWHILAACAANRVVTALIGVTNGLKDADAYEFAYHLWVFPYLRRLPSAIDQAEEKVTQEK
jgi:dihydroceramidase